MLVTDAGGRAGPTLGPDELAKLQEKARSDGEACVRAAAETLRIDNIETRVLEGRPGPSLCWFAEEVTANAIALGTRGRGRIKRALLGSVANYVVRNAPVLCSSPARRCPRPIGEIARESEPQLWKFSAGPDHFARPLDH